MNNGRFTVFGVKKGDPAWMEALLCDTGSKERFELCLRKAAEYGYKITRVYKPNTNLEVPNFASCVNI